MAAQKPAQLWLDDLEEVLGRVVTEANLQTEIQAEVEAQPDETTEDEVSKVLRDPKSARVLDSLHKLAPEVPRERVMEVAVAMLLEYKGHSDHRDEELSKILLAIKAGMDALLGRIKVLEAGAISKAHQASTPTKGH